MVVVVRNGDILGRVIQEKFKHLNQKLFRLDVLQVVVIDLVDLLVHSVQLADDGVAGREDRLQMGQ